jgi:hypothetical protein
MEYSGIPLETLLAILAERKMERAAEKAVDNEKKKEKAAEKAVAYEGVKDAKRAVDEAQRGFNAAFQGYVLPFEVDLNEAKETHKQCTAAFTAKYGKGRAGSGAGKVVRKGVPEKAILVDCLVSLPSDLSPVALRKRLHDVLHRHQGNQSTDEHRTALFVALLARVKAHVKDLEGAKPDPFVLLQRLGIMPTATVLPAAPVLTAETATATVV